MYFNIYLYVYYSVLFNLILIQFHLILINHFINNSLIYIMIHIKFIIINTYLY